MQFWNNFLLSLSSHCQNSKTQLPDTMCCTMFKVLALIPCCLWTCNSILVMKSMIYISCTGTKHGKSEKNESKQIENKHTSNVLHANTPENSPKRKRTRNTASSASPATPDVPPPKRRRWSQNLLSYSCCEGFFCVTDTCVQIWYAYKEKLFQL